jgi:two-component SAPR family response regulator
VDVASQILSRYQRQIKTSQSTYEQGLGSLLKGRLYLLQDEPGKAISHFQNSKNAFAQTGRDIETLWSMVWLASAHLRSGQTKKAVNEIISAIKASNINDHALLVSIFKTGTYLDELRNGSVVDASIKTLLEHSQALGEKLPSVRRVLRRHAQSIQMPAAKLIVQAFGRPDVIYNGRAVNMSDWRTQSVRDLFFFFLHKRNTVTKEQIGEAIWQETDDPQALKKRFKNEIYRLRRAVGRDVIVFDDEFYCFNRGLDYEYDVEVFDTYLKRARKSRDVEEQIKWYQRAVELVRGPYLADVGADWVIYERARLVDAYIAALEELARLYLNVNQLEHCLSTCKLGLDQDNCNEVLYQLSMRAHAARGDRASIARSYQECKTALELGLNLAPSSETETLFHELTA